MLVIHIIIIISPSLQTLHLSLCVSGFSSLTLYHFTSALCAGPGFLALGWAPASEAERQQLQFCGQCQGFKVSTTSL